MYKRIISVFCALAVTLTSVLPAHAEPVITEITAAEVTGQAQPAAPLVTTNPVYLPLIGKPQCYVLNSLSPISAATAASETCANLGAYVGSQAPANMVATVADGHATLFDTDMPHVTVSIPLTGTHIGPQSNGAVSSRIIRLSAVSYMTDTVEAAAVADAPFAGRIAWTIMNALQDKASTTPTLFPVSIATPHYSKPQTGALSTNLFVKCGSHLNAGDLALPGFPYDLIVDDDMTRGGSVWLAIKYPSCPEISGFPYIKLFDFWRNLKAFSQYQHIENEAAAIVGPSTYHVSNLQMRMPDGQTILIGATIVVVVVGAVVIIAIFPEVGIGWWLLSGAAALQQEEAKQNESITICLFGN